MNKRIPIQNDRPRIHIIAPIKEFLRRFSIFLFLAITVTTILLSTMDNKFILMLRSNFMDAILPVMQVLSKPAQMAEHISDAFYDMVNMHEENNRLRHENDALNKRYQLSDQFAEENKQLHQLLHVVPEPQRDFKTARVVGDLSGPYIRSAIVNAGSEQNIKKGQVVINDEGLVGRIIDTGRKTARLLLITDVNSRIPIITEKTHERAIIAGTGIQNLTLLYLPEDSKAAIGEMVLTSGDGALFPPGLPIGKIIARQDKVITVQPIVNLNRLEFVMILSAQ